MPTITEAIVKEGGQTRTVTIDGALDQGSGDYLCPECEKPVRPHRAGGHTAAHFEHLERNRNCSLSHRG